MRLILTILTSTRILNCNLHVFVFFNSLQSCVVNFDLAVHPGMQSKGNFSFFSVKPGPFFPLHASMFNAHAVLSGMCPRCLFTNFSPCQFPSYSQTCCTTHKGRKYVVGPLSCSNARLGVSQEGKSAQQQRKKNTVVYRGGKIIK